jgi:uncharacterized membrane protein YjjP (DUF1212 family)
MVESTRRALEDAAANEAAVGFILRLGKALHGYGLAAHGLEDALSGAASRIGLEAQFFTTPTSIFAAFGRPETQSTHLIRVFPGDVDLGKLAALDEVTSEVHAGTLTPAEGSQRIDRIIASPPPYGRATRVLATGVASAAVCRVLVGGATEVVVAGAAGLLVGLLALASRRLPHASHVYELVASMAVAALVSLVATVGGVAVSVPTATLAGVIVLLPGLTLTLAMTELASRHLAAGTARLSGAFIVFIAMTFGVAVGNRVAAAIAGPAAAVNPTDLPTWTLWLALAIAPLAFGVYLRARPRDIGWLLLASLVGYGAVRVGAVALGPAMGASIGSLVVGVMANLYERRGLGPATVPLVPGVLLLVPGSMGYRSMASLLDQNVIVGVTTGFTMILTAVALAAGLLVANVLVPPGRFTDDAS